MITIGIKISMIIPGYTSLSTSPTAQHNPPWTKGLNNSGFVRRLMMMMINRSIMMMTNTLEMMSFSGKAAKTSALPCKNWKMAR